MRHDSTYCRLCCCAEFPSSLWRGSSTPMSHLSGAATFCLEGVVLAGSGQELAVLAGSKQGRAVLVGSGQERVVLAGSGQERAVLAGSGQERAVLLGRLRSGADRVAGRLRSGAGRVAGRLQSGAGRVGRLRSGAGRVIRGQRCCPPLSFQRSNRDTYVCAERCCVQQLMVEGGHQVPSATATHRGAHDQGGAPVTTQALLPHPLIIQSEAYVPSATAVHTAARVAIACACQSSSHETHARHATDASHRAPHVCHRDMVC